MAKRVMGGYTLLEFVMATGMVGVLAATAVPNYMDMMTAARTTKVTMLYQDLVNSAAMAHAVRAQKGGAPGDPVVLGGQSVAMNNDYPTADADGIKQAANLDEALSQVVFDPAGATAGSLFVSPVGAPSAATCGVRYQEAAPSQPPVFSVVTSGC